MKKQKKSNLLHQANGITLIALVISIIVMLILAGVSINAIVGDNGILTQAMNASSKTNKASEQELIQMQMAEIQIDGMLENNGEERSFGTVLYDKTLENASRWKIAYDKSTGKTYGTGWRYISKGTTINNTKLNHSYLINDVSNEIIEYKEDDENITFLSYSDSVGVADNLIFNLDPGLIDDINGLELSEDEKKQKIQSQLGSNVELCNMNFNDENTGINGAEFDLDGEDDAIRIVYSSNADRQKITDNGITFEFYGIFNDGKIKWIKRDVLDSSGNIRAEPSEKTREGRNGILMYTILDAEKTYLEHYDNPPIDKNSMTAEEYEKATKEARKFSVDANAIRFSLVSDGEKVNTLYWNCGKGNSNLQKTEENAEYESDYSSGNNYFNQLTPIEFKNGEEVYLTFTLSPNNNYIKDGKEMLKYKIFINGKKVIEAGYNKKEWDAFIADFLPYIGEFHIGRTIYNSSQYYYSKLSAYSIKLYSKALTDDEVRLNYEKTLAYHQYLVNKGK